MLDTFQLISNSYLLSLPLVANFALYIFFLNSLIKIFLLEIISNLIFNKNHFSCSSPFTRDAWKREFNKCQYKWLKMPWDQQQQHTRKNPIPCSRMARCVSDHENSPIRFQQFSINVNTEHKPTAEI